MALFYPSCNQILSQNEQVTMFPKYWCAVSWARLIFLNDFQKLQWSKLTNTDNGRDSSSLLLCRNARDVQ